MVAIQWLPPRGGKQAVRHFGAFLEPVSEHGPKLRDRNFGDGVRCRALIPFGRLLGLTTWPVLWQRRLDDEAQARRPRWSSSEFGMYRAQCSRDRYRSHGNLRRGPAGPGSEPGS